MENGSHSFLSHHASHHTVLSQVHQCCPCTEESTAAPSTQGVVSQVLRRGEKSNPSTPLAAVLLLQSIVWLNIFTTRVPCYFSCYAPRPVFGLASAEEILTCYRSLWRAAKMIKGRSACWKKRDQGVRVFVHTRERKARHLVNVFPCKGM